MSTHSNTPSLPALAGALAGTFPGSDDARLARALLRTPARGPAVSMAMLASAASRDEQAAAAEWIAGRGGTFALTLDDPFERASLATRWLLVTEGDF